MNDYSTILKQIASGKQLPVRPRTSNGKPIVITGKKFSNEFTTAFVKKLREKKLPDKDIVDTLLKFDKQIEIGKVTEKDILKLINK